MIGGIGAFVIVADDYDDFADAIRLKLIQEIKATPIAALPAPRYAASPPPASQNRISPAARAFLYSTTVAIR